MHLELGARTGAWHREPERYHFLSISTYGQGGHSPLICRYKWCAKKRPERRFKFRCPHHVTHPTQTEKYNSYTLLNPVRVTLVPRIPLIEDLTSAPIPRGSNLLVEFDPASEWYNASINIAAGLLTAGEIVGYNVAAQPPERIRAQLGRLGLDARELEKLGRLRLTDFYTATLGQKSEEHYAFDSLKVADLSIMISTQLMRPVKEKSAPVGFGDPDNFLNIFLRIADNVSTLARFNEEKAWIEFILTRAFPLGTSLKQTQVFGLVEGLHSDGVYKALEAASDGVIDFKLEEVANKVGQRAASIIRIRSMRDVPFDARWHRLKTGENFELTIEE